MIFTDVIIIGAGPAGIAAAVQLKRNRINIEIIEKNTAGGLIRSANLVENYPGFPAGIDGSKMGRLLANHLERWDIVPVEDEVVSAGYSGEVFIAECSKGSFAAKFLIIATGTDPVKTEIPGWREAFGKSAFNEIIPLLTVENKNIAIIGSGDAAFDYALNLGRKNRVTVNYRSERAKCLPLLFERALVNPAIELKKNRVLKKINSVIDRLTLEWEDDVDESDFLLAAIGREANLNYADETLSSRLQKLQADGVLYLAGDVKNGRNRQMAIAAGDGLKAALAIIQKSEQRGS